MTQLRPVATAWHVLWATFSSLPAIVRITWPALVVSILVQVTFMMATYFFIARGGDLQHVTPTIIAFNVLFFILLMLPMYSVAVNWFRYLLRDEEATGWQRLRLDRPVWRYIGNTLLLNLLFIVPAGICIFIWAAFMWRAGPESAPSIGFPVMLLLFFCGWLWIVLAGLRLSVRLPSVALDDGEISFGEAWKLTSGNGLRLLACMLVFFVLCLIFALVACLPLIMLRVAAMSTENLAVQLLLAVCQMVVSWVMLMAGLTMQAALYGIFAEGQQV